MNKKLSFIVKITIIHVSTYIICGIIFSNLFNYEELFQLGNAKYFMRETYGISSILGLFAQIIRGILFGIILLIIKESIWGKSFAWFRLWAVVAGIGIINTYAPAPVSIEGILYTQLPLEFHLKSATEIFTQSMLFSIFATDSFKIKVLEKYEIPTIITVISGILFSICGIILSLVLKVDFMKSATDIGAFVTMACSLTVVFIITKIYISSKIVSLIYYFICYIALATFPTIYNYISDSLLKSPISLIISGLPVIVIWLYFRYVYKVVK